METFASNTLGTVHLLDALRQLQARYRADDRTCAGVFITTDKCYENREWLYGYREDDALGGYDPYSASKAAAEIAIAAYRRSYFNPDSGTTFPRIGIASARAGNVIGGGDWSEDRIVPDCIRHLQRGEPIPVRNAMATRPWQHVLEPLSGYLQLAAHQRQALRSRDAAVHRSLCGAYNFGPSLQANQPVSVLVEQILKHWPGRWLDQSDPDAPHEASRLNLAWDKAFRQLGWQPHWDFYETIRRTVDWYLFGPGDDPSKFTTRVTRQCLRNVGRLPLTSGAQRRDFIAVEDVVAAYQTILRNLEAIGRGYSEIPVGSGRAVSIRALVETIRDLTGSRTRLDFGALPQRDGEPMESKSDNSRLAALGWYPRTDLVDGLRRLVADERRRLGPPGPSGSPAGSRDA